MTYASSDQTLLLTSINIEKKFVLSHGGLMPCSDIEHKLNRSFAKDDVKNNRYLTPTITRFNSARKCCTAVIHGHFY